MLDGGRGYRAYLVRLWQARSGGRVVWRASAEDAHTGERQAFAELEELFAFLEDVTAGPSGTSVAGSPDTSPGAGCSLRSQTEGTEGESP